MLEALTGRLRVALQKLADQKDPSFLESVERWRATERDIHGIHQVEMEVLVAQAAFVLAVLGTYTLHSERTENNACLSPVTYSRLQSQLESDDARFGAYLRIARPGLPVLAQELAEIPLPGRGIDVFSPLYQAMFSSSQKHASGEHYTPTDLCLLMLGRVCMGTSTRMLDPTCGAGAFVVSAIAKARIETADRGDYSYISRIHGQDLNPLAVLATRVNAWLQVKDLGAGLESFFPTIRVADALSSSPGVYDLVIGNPPWVTLKDFSNKDRQVHILQQAKDLQVAPDAHGVPQLELATVVFTRSARELLAPGGIVFFVMTRSFMDGKHCSAFRALNGLEAVEVWLFSGQSVFPKTFACLRGRRATGEASYFSSADALPVRSWEVATAGNDGDQLTFTAVEDALFTPVNLAAARVAAQGSGNPGNLAGLGRFISVHDVGSLLPTSNDPYYKRMCYNGATIFPQSLLFVDIIETSVDGDINLVRVMPFLGIHAKRPWNARFYDSAVVERRYLFSLVKGSELHPFGIHEPCRVFLPLKRGSTSYEFDTAGFAGPSPARASMHFQAIDDAYKRTCKGLDRIKDLWSRINFDNELTNEAMAKPYKVIIPDCGSTMAAAIVPGDFIVEHALHYIGLDDERESLYLLGILNAPCIEKDVLLRKSERHIGQLALDYNIPPFDPANPDHASIESLAREIQREVKRAIDEYISKIQVANEGKFQCRACTCFVSAAAIDGHARSCKKMPRAPGVVPRASMFIEIAAGAPSGTASRLTRATIKRIMGNSTTISKLLAILDGQVIRLLGEGGARA